MTNYAEQNMAVEISDREYESALNRMVRAYEAGVLFLGDLDRAIRRLLRERDELAKDAAKYRWGINNARWIRSEQESYVAIPVAPDADLSCVAMRDAAIDAAMEGDP